MSKRTRTRAGHANPTTERRRRAAGNPKRIARWWRWFWKKPAQALCKSLGIIEGVTFYRDQE